MIFGLASLARWYPAADPVKPAITSIKADQKVESKDRPTSPSARLASYPFAKYGQFPAGYVGTAVCASCHTDRHESYLKTHHSRSLREVDLASEPLDQTLVHPLSKRSYDIVAEDGRLWHREWRYLSHAAGDRFQSNQLPVCYVMGSGAFAKGYLLGDGDYLLQSPVTWYAGSEKFGMAPNYDREAHFGFTRMIHDECLFCHAGLVRRRNDNPYHPAIIELSIGCERCHGAGAEHAQLFRRIESGELKSSTGLDPQIVNPKKLSRTQTESICGQCHLHGDVTANGPGAELWDFVPGNDFAETRVHFKSGAAGEFTKAFTGHFDQMWQSACYQNSDSLTCTTCHDPHLSETITDRVKYRRDQCNLCHEDQPCGLPLDQRMAHGQNDCIKCHMPSVESDVPHTSTTSHWIAVYDSGKPRGMDSSSGNADSNATLRRVQSSPALSDEELARRDLLGQSFWIENQVQLGELQPLISFQQQNELEVLIRGEHTDAEIYSLMARMARMIADGTAETPENRAAIDAQWQLAATHAIETLRLEKRPVKTRAAALEVLGSQLMETADYGAALDCFAELTQIRRVAVDWYHLGLCLAREKRLADAERAPREAIRIDGTYAAPYRSLSLLYQSIDPAAAQQFAVIAERLMQP